VWAIVLLSGSKEVSAPMNKAEKEGGSHPYVILARMSVELTARKEDPALRIDPSLFSDLPSLDQPGACFVSIKKGSGELRGCIGTIYPVYPRLRDEIIHNSEASAGSDPRFPPLEPGETRECLISVDVLEDPVPVAGLLDLNPRIFGVIVEKGHQRGVLLPDLKGIDTPEEQVSIAMRKAGINNCEGMKLWKFRVSRYKE